MYNTWIQKNTTSLEGKVIAVTGSTGGIGKELCRYLAQLGASLILLDRNRQKSEALREELVKSCGTDVTCITVDLEDMNSVRQAVSQLKSLSVDIFLHNAGAYSIPRRTCDTGFDNVFQINFVSPYYMIRDLLDGLRERGGNVVVVGSIAHNYSKTDPADIDFSTRKQASLVYGNAKRYLMFSLYELFRDKTDATLAVTHPGITFTNITAHYPPGLFAIIKHPMKVIFMKPRKACLSVLRGIFDKCGYHEWIGPRVFDVWGLPAKSRLHTVSTEESRFIGKTAEKIYQNLK